MGPSGAVEGKERQRIVVEVEPGEPIRGSVSTDVEPERPFVGLMQLVAAIDSARNAAPPTAAAVEPKGGG